MLSENIARIQYSLRFDRELSIANRESLPKDAVDREYNDTAKG